jgi:hypothetical protein
MFRIFAIVTVVIIKTVFRDVTPYDLVEFTVVPEETIASICLRRLSVSLNFGIFASDCTLRHVQTAANLILV